MTTTEAPPDLDVSQIVLGPELDAWPTWVCLDYYIEGFENPSIVATIRNPRLTAYGIFGSWQAAQVYGETNLTHESFTPIPIELVTSDAPDGSMIVYSAGHKPDGSGEPSVGAAGAWDNARTLGVWLMHEKRKPENVRKDWGFARLTLVPCPHG